MVCRSRDSSRPAGSTCRTSTSTWTSSSAIEFAKKLYGRIRQFGAHAGGFVITSNLLTEGRSCIVSRGKDKALCWDMELAEELGFIKFDFLGIDSLSAIKVVGDF